MTVLPVLGFPHAVAGLNRQISFANTTCVKCCATCTHIDQRFNHNIGTL